MTRTISLIIGIAVVALAAVPTAVGTPSPREQVDAVKFFYANERATVPFPAAVHDHGNATEARLLLKSPTIGIVRDNGDATQAKLVQSPTIGIVRDNGDATQAKLVQSPTIGIVRDNGDATQAKLAWLRGGTGSEIVRLSGDGRHIEWSQIGIGFGIGMLLAIGLGLSLRATRPRTLAH